MCSAIGVDAERWNDVVCEVRDWRLRLGERYGIDSATELHPLALVTRPQTERDRGRVSRPVSPHSGVEILLSGLHLIERASLKGGVEAINVCLPTMQRGRSAEVGLGRLLTRINTSVAADGRYAFPTFDEGQQEQVARLYRRLRVHNPIPSRFETWEDGAPTRNVPLRCIIGGPAFRRAEDDHLLQMVAFVSYALLLQEEGAGPAREDLGLERAFSILDRALNRQASRRDPQGVVRR